MATFRTIKESGDFVTVHKDFIYDSNLSAKAKGILLYFLSRPDNWQIYTSEVVKHMNDGQKSINSGIQELIANKYVHRIQKRTKAGVFSGYEYHVYEKPTEMPFSANGLSANGFSENGKTENRKGQTTNNNSTNNDSTNNNSTNNDGTILSGNPTVPYQQVVDYLNEKTGKQYKHTTKKTQSLIKARTKEGFSLDDFKQVIDNMSSQWMNDSKMNQYLRPETLFGTKFEGYLNQQQSNAVDEDWKKQYEDVF